MITINGEPIIWHNAYMGRAITERNCRICFGDLVVYSKGVGMWREEARFCNHDLSEMLPAMTEFVERKKTEDDVKGAGE